MHPKSQILSSRYHQPPLQKVVTVALIKHWLCKADTLGTSQALAHLIL